MHEVSIAEGILSAVKSTLVNEPQAKVTSVTVSIGELAGIEIQAKYPCKKDKPYPMSV